MGNKELAKDLLELGKFYFFNEKYDEAIRVLQKSVKFDPSLAETYYNLGLIYEAKNENIKAKEMHLKALEADPKFKCAQERVNRLVGT